MNPIFSKVRSKINLSAVSSLQIFQLTRYAGFLMIGIAFAKLGINKAEIGRFEYFVMLMGIFSFFWIAGLMNSVLAIYGGAVDEERRALLSRTFLLMMILSAATGLVQLTVPGGSLIGLVYLLVNNTSYIVEYILFLHQQRRRLIVYGITMTVLIAVLCILPVYIYGDVQYAIYGLICLGVIKTAYALLLLREHRLDIYSPIGLRHLFWYSAPLMFGFMVSNSAEYIDSLIVKHYFSLADLSVFRYGARDFPLFTTLAATLSMSMVPRISENLHAGLKAIKQNSLRYMHFFFPVAIILILSSQWLFTLVFSPQFVGSAHLFAVLMLLVIYRMVFPQSILTGLRENRWLLAIAIIEMLINIIASVLMAQRFGLIGVAYGTLVAFVSEKTIMMLLLYQRHRIAPQQYIPLLPFAMYSAATVLAYIVSLNIY